VRVDVPEAGYYKRRFVRGGPWVACQIWFGAPMDPVTGEPLERSHRWQARVDGELVTDEMRVLDTWISCAGNPISPEEYERMIAKSGDAVYSEPTAPEANPRNRVDLRAMRPITPPRR